MRTSLALLSLLCVSVTWSGLARADVLPPDGCTMLNQPCQNAGPSHNQSGVCTTSTCTKQLPSWDAPMSYPCGVCLVSDAGTSSGTAGKGGQGGAGGAGGSAGAAGASATGGISGAAGASATGGTTSHGGGSSGCAIAPAGAAGSGAQILVVLAAAGLAVARRRRHGSR
jgi:MYXO-CTERM domain-containing protein